MKQHLLSAVRARIVPPLAATLFAVGLLAGARISGAEPPAAEAEAPAPYIRLVEGDGGALTLELVSRSFRRADGSGPTVRLVSAVHIGDKRFYEAKQTELDACDVVLFEGVKSSGLNQIDPGLDDLAKAAATRKRLEFLSELMLHVRAEQGSFPNDMASFARDAGRLAGYIERSSTDGWGRPVELSIVEIAPPADGSTTAPASPLPGRRSARFVSLGADGTAGGAGAAADIIVETKAIADDRKIAARSENIQARLARTLGVAFQLNEIDSSKPHWRNSDIDIDALRERLEAAGPQAAMMLRLLDGSGFESAIAGVVLSLIGTSKTLTTMVKVVMLEQLANADELFSSVKGMEAMHEVIIEERNRIVLDDLRKAMTEVPAESTIAIFYGAGHMPAFERCLRSEFALRPTGDVWTPAMMVNPAEAGISASQAKEMRGWLRGMLKRAATSSRPPAGAS